MLRIHNPANLRGWQMNAFVVPAREWLAWTGSTHEQVRDMPDGDQVRMKVVD